jgi:hypothetical protein
MSKISTAPRVVNVCSSDYEREHNGNEPQCVRDALEQPDDEIGPTVRAAYERMCDGKPIESEFPEIANFGKWARGRRGKPVCLAVLKLVLALQRHHDGLQRREGKLREGTHATFVISGDWVARMLKKYGVRPDMTDGTREHNVYEILGVLQDVGTLRLQVAHSGIDDLAREFTVWTVAELAGKPPVFTPVPEPTVAAVIADIERDARESATDMEGQFERECAALRERVKMAPSRSKRRLLFERRFRESHAALCLLRRERHRAEDAAHCPFPKPRVQPTRLSVSGCREAVQSG